MKIAIEHNLESEEASMCNELGQHYMNTIGGKEAEPFIRRSVFLYENLKDSNNYMNSLCKLMHLNLIYEEFAKIDSIAKIIIPIRAGRNWYGTDQSFYRSYANRFLHVGDSLNYYRWALKEKEAAIQMQRVRTENNLNHYRISFETEKLKNNVIESNQATEKKETELGEERNFSNDLIFTLFALGIIFLVVIVLLIRQRKLSKGLKASNARYQMLMTESNHRIKNNLQMIISMMEYASNDVKNSGPEAFKKISSKIQVISVLHKFLYADVHNENVEMALYFNEIVNLHSKMNSNEFEVLQDICPVEIKSERMIYFGLIFNELLANSFEHNKTDEQKVVITVTALSDGFILEYCDNSKHEISNGTGTGSVLIEQLIRRVKGKNYSLDKETGRYKFTFHGSI
jgi:two-component sensor histidine kinase